MPFTIRVASPLRTYVVASFKTRARGARDEISTLTLSDDLKAAYQFSDRRAAVTTRQAVERVFFQRKTARVQLKES